MSIASLGFSLVPVSKHEQEKVETLDPDRECAMDEIARYNRDRWRALSKANALFTRPALDLDTDSARRLVDPDGRLGNLEGKDVLCLASGGGRQSAGFALLGSRVTVLDLSEDQLRRDQEAAAHYVVDIQTRQGDMRDLSCFGADAFDIVNHAYSLGFVPNARTIFEQVARVIRNGGIYYFHCANPFFVGLGETDWNGEGYTIKHRYIDGAAVTYDDQYWVYDRAKADDIPPPREYRHTLSTLISGLVEQGFLVTHISDEFDHDAEAEPGTWHHLVSVAPPWLEFWAIYRPY